MKPMQFLLVVLFLAGCSSTPEERPAEPKGDVQALEVLCDTSSLFEYHDWDLFPGSSEQMDGARGSGPHGRYVTVYANDVAVDAAGTDAMEMPEGSFIMKDAFDEDRNLRSTVLMAKLDSTWYYGAMKIHSPDSVDFLQFGAAESDEISTCHSCHAKADRDFVFLWK
jgi:hypothetical protein